jgi:hypothetical protein
MYKHRLSAHGRELQTNPIVVRNDLMPVPEQPLRELLPLVENLISVLIARDYKSAELTALLIWMNSHCNACGRLLTAENQSKRNDLLCANCA